MLQDIEKIKGKRILVVGDLMLDVYLSGRASRISPEAPVPVVTAQKKSLIPGGSANVAANLVELGCAVTIAGFIGEDDEGKFLQDRFCDLGINAESVIETSFPTICKMRVMANGQHIVRYDIDSNFRSIVNNALIDHLEVLGSMRHFDAVIVSDYNKGTITQDVMSAIKTHFSCPIFCDIKPPNKKNFQNVWAIAPNLEEARQMVANSSLGVEDIARCLKEDLSLKSVIITMADEGIFGLDENDECWSFPAHTSIDEHDPRQRFDVTGAGDTVLSVFSTCVVSGMLVKEALLVANVAAGIVVNKIGTATCGYNELFHEVQRQRDHEGATA